MKLFSITLFSLLLLFSTACASDQQAGPPEHTVAGQLLLPSGMGSRGVEVLITIADTDSDPKTVWLLFDEQGRFAYSFLGNLTNVSITAGSKAEVHRVDTEDLLTADQTGHIDLGVIDLRDQLARHRMVLRAAEGRPQSDVRVGMWYGLPPVGPSGEPVSLGSRQFPSIPLGSEIEWLLAHEAHSIYFLAEWPTESSGGTEWWGGRQQLFGPFKATEIPTELILQ